MPRELQFFVAVVTYLENLPQAHATLADFRKSDWGSEPAIFVQPPHWPKGKPSASANYKRALVAAAESGGTRKGTGMGQACACPLFARVLRISISVASVASVASSGGMQND